MCTGVYTAEMALAACANIINKSEVLDFRVDVRCVACWDWASVQECPVLVLYVLYGKN